MTTPEPAPAFGSAWSASLARAPEATLREWLEFALEACDVTDQAEPKAGAGSGVVICP